MDQTWLPLATAVIASVVTVYTTATNRRRGPMAERDRIRADQELVNLMEVDSESRQLLQRYVEHSVARMVTREAVLRRSRVGLGMSLFLIFLGAGVASGAFLSDVTWQRVVYGFVGGVILLTGVAGLSDSARKTLRDENGNTITSQTQASDENAETAGP